MQESKRRARPAFLKGFSMNTTQKGRLYEEKALSYLIDKGFSLVARNFHTRYGELDLIMQKDGILHFVEVKGGVSMDPLLHITSSKLEKIIKSIDVFLAKQAHSGGFCVDALSIMGDEILFIENITI